MIPIGTIAVIGGGPAGLFTAIALHRLQHKVVVVEAGEYAKQRAGEHIGASAKSLMQSLNIPLDILENNSIRCAEVSGAWGQAELQSRASIFDPYGDGYILKRPAFDQALAVHCAALGIEVLTGTRVHKVERKDNNWVISSSEERVRARFLVDASGRTSKFASSLNTSQSTFDNLIGLTQILRPKLRTAVRSSYLLIEATSNGWWYSVQLPSGDLAATLMTDAGELGNSKLGNEAFWQQELRQTLHTKDRLSSFTADGYLFTQSAKTQIQRALVGPSWLAVGDAAMSFDPLSSSGILKGMRMGITAATKLDQWLKGDKEALINYEQDCRRIFDEYVIQKKAYYALENRFNDQPFWYSRNIHPKEIESPFVLPTDRLSLLPGNHQRKLAYLADQLPEVAVKELAECVGRTATAQDALKEYLCLRQESQLRKAHFQALAALEAMAVITVQQ